TSCFRVIDASRQGARLTAVVGERVLRVGLRGRTGDCPVTALVDRLQAVSADFRRSWAEHEVALRRVERKILPRPRVGGLLMDGESLVTPDQGQ
ncbi:hypothetical protein ABH930_006739, partial [Kitasatospora sp. GAS204A]|nr:hypothetical protein [Kitasatospora sp. GAS204B]